MEFRLLAAGRHVDFEAFDRLTAQHAVKTAMTMLWNDLHPAEVEARVEAYRQELIDRHGSVGAAVEAIMKDVS